ncbi:unnamed protein product [Amoebophrya sp. A25]|nr:unnamed protein product [Amoebophrya sp. A25]|eukprot:GSA25T00003019001.1
MVLLSLFAMHQGGAGGYRRRAQQGTTVLSLMVMLARVAFSDGGVALTLWASSCLPFLCTPTSAKQWQNVYHGSAPLGYHSDESSDFYAPAEGGHAEYEDDEDDQVDNGAQQETKSSFIVTATGESKKHKQGSFEVLLQRLQKLQARHATLQTEGEELIQAYLSSIEQLLKQQEMTSYNEYRIEIVNLASVFAQPHFMPSRINIRDVTELGALPFFPLPSAAEATAQHEAKTAQVQVEAQKLIDRKHPRTIQFRFQINLLSPNLPALGEMRNSVLTPSYQLNFLSPRVFQDICLHRLPELSNGDDRCLEMGKAERLIAQAHVSGSQAYAGRIEVHNYRTGSGEKIGGFEDFRQYLKRKLEPTSKAKYRMDCQVKRTGAGEGLMETFRSPFVTISFGR